MPNQDAESRESRVSERPSELKMDEKSRESTSIIRRSVTSRLTPSRLTPSRRKAKVAVDENQFHTATIKLAESSKIVSATVTLNPSPQHTLTWHEPIALPVAVNGKPATLMPGSCNLYGYPKVFFSHLRKGKGVVPPAEQLFVLEELVRALILDEDDPIAFVRDPAGATPVHGLLVANTPAALHLAVKCYRERPVLLAQTHTGKIFTGENALHILCVNSQEDELCECIEIAAASLDAEKCKAIFQMQATGLFFQDEPQAWYGSTPVGFAVAFSLQRALTTMLVMTKEHPAMSGVIDFNDPHFACKLTGFMPLHVAVANSLTNMVNFLLDLPGLTIDFDDMRALPIAMTSFGKLSDWSLLTPLQVATKLGDKKLVQYILRTQSKVQWVWGPVSLYHLDLNGIDSVGETGNDVMELVARLDASDATQEMLLDTFMDGLLHKLFEQKFRMAKWLHYLMCGIQAVSVTLMYVVAMWIKEQPDDILYPQYWLPRWMPYICLACMVPLLEEDLRSAAKWWINARSGPMDDESKKLLATRGCAGKVIVYTKDLRMLFKWMQSHKMFSKMIGWAFAVLACIWLLNLRTYARSDPRWDPSLVTARDRTDVLLAPLAIACWFHTEAFFRTFLFEFEKLGIFYKTVFTMLATDVRNWLFLFIIFFINYGMVMYVAYPRFAHTPDDIALVNASFADPPPGMVQYSNMAIIEAAPKMMKITSTIQALIELAFIGEPLEFDLQSAYSLTDGSERSAIKNFLFYFFYVFYIYYIVMSLILLLNLLIAMMGDTYATSMEHATLGWRVDFARRVLRLELQLQIFHKCGCISLHCGEKVGSGPAAQYVYPFKTYQANAEGGGIRGATQSMFDEQIEEEAEEDEKDDDGPGASGEEGAPGAAPMASLVKVVGSASDLLIKNEQSGAGRRQALKSKLASKLAGMEGGGRRTVKIVAAGVVMVEPMEGNVGSKGGGGVPTRASNGGGGMPGGAPVASATVRPLAAGAAAEGEPDVEEIEELDG